jgi:hypothetical protein
VHQYQEPSELVCLLGGTLAIRQVKLDRLVVSAAPTHRNVQGIRAHWSSENTAMHSVRSYNGSIFIEEHDLVSLSN